MKRKPLTNSMPTFVNDKGLWFDHFLALKLSCTVEELKAKLTKLAYMRWVVYFAMEAQQKELAVAEAKQKK